MKCSAKNMAWLKGKSSIDKIELNCALGGKGSRKEIFYNMEEEDFDRTIAKLYYLGYKVKRTEYQGFPAIEVSW